jgi:ADP-heptose:LPS heptosyltransferase
MSDISQNKTRVPDNHFVSNYFWRMLPAGMRRRWWLFRFFDLVAKYMPVFRVRSGVLVVRMDGIGDMVLFRTALDHYAEVFGVEKFEITVVGCDSWGSITDEVFKDYKILTIDEHSFARWPLYRFWVSLKVRSINPAISVCDSYLRRALMADSLMWISGAPRMVSSLPFISEGTRAEYQYYLSQIDEIIPTGGYPTHEALRHFNFLSSIAGRQIKAETPRISWRDSLPSADIVPSGVPYVILNPGSNEFGRRWPLIQYQELAKKLANRGLLVIFVGGKSERPGAIHESPGRIIDLIGKTSLEKLLDLMNHAELVVSNDTGPAHLSIAIATPTLVIVGGGHFGCFVPYPEEIRPAYARFVYHRMDCYHCFWNCPKRATKFDVFPCVEAVHIDEVWRVSKQLLDAKE